MKNTSATKSIIKHGGVYGWRHKNVYICLYIYSSVDGSYSITDMIEAIFNLEDTFRSWTMSLEFMTGSCIILGINLIDYLKA